MAASRYFGTFRTTCKATKREHVATVSRTLRKQPWTVMTLTAQRLSCATQRKLSWHLRAQPACAHSQCSSRHLLEIAAGEYCPKSACTRENCPGNLLPTMNKYRSYLRRAGFPPCLPAALVEQIWLCSWEREPLTSAVQNFACNPQVISFFVAIARSLRVPVADAYFLRVSSSTPISALTLADMACAAHRTLIRLGAQGRCMTLGLFARKPLAALTPRLGHR